VLRDGSEDRSTEGAELGTVLGDIIGTGTLLGDPLISIEGDTVETTEGITDGLIEGVEEDAALGVVLGDTLGTKDGVANEILLGDALGFR